MANKVVVPGTASEINTYIQKLFENRSHIKSITLDPSRLAIRVDLDRAANFMGYPDFDIPVRGNQLFEAESLVNELNSSLRTGQTPSNSIGERLDSVINRQLSTGSS